MLSTIFSNQIEVLAQILREDLKNPKDALFRRKIIITPSESIRNWLMYASVERHSSIFAGVQLVTLYEALQEIGYLLGDEEMLQIPSTLQISFALESQIRTLQAQQPDSFAPLWNYINSDSRRLIDICDALASEFRESLEGLSQAVVPNMEKSWQYILWESIFPQSLRENIDAVSPEKLTLPIDLYIFGFDFLPPLYCTLFGRLNARFYLASPSQVFWGDLRTAKEQVSFQRRLRSSGATLDLLEEYAGYLYDQHQFLANFSKAGRSFWKMLDERGGVSHESFVPIESASLLGQVQRDIFEGESISESFCVHDGTIQIHAAPTFLREIEVLHDFLLNLFNEHYQQGIPLAPADVLIIAPDINRYAPFVRSVFSARSPQIPFALQGLKRIDTQPFLYAFQYLLSIWDRGFDKSSIVHLFSFPHFQKKWGFSEKERRTAISWLEKMDVFVGLDEENRAHILNQPDYDHKEKGTWRAALNATLDNWICGDKGGVSIEVNQSDLFATVVTILKALKTDLKSLSDEERKPLFQWTYYIEALADKYFVVEEEDKRFFRDLAEFSQKFHGDDKATFTFQSIKRLIADALEREAAAWNANEINAVKFYSLRKGPFAPHKVVCVLGLDEEQFPQKDVGNSLLTLAKELKNEVKINGPDKDRFALLQLIINTRRVFYTSYCSFSRNDQKPQNPSLPLQELMDYLKERFSENALDLKVHTHSPFALPQTTFDEVFYDAAGARKNKNEKSPILDLPELSACNREFSFNELASFSRYPLQHVLKKTAGIYLEDKALEAEEEFALSRLNRSRLLGSFIKDAKLPEYDDISEKLPRGVFGRAAYLDLKKDWDEISSNIIDMTLSPEHFFSVILAKGCDEIFAYSLKECHHPQWEITKGCFLTGTVDTLSKKGIVLMERYADKELVRYWPHMLLANYFVRSGLFQSQTLFFVKNGKKVAIDVPDCDDAMQRFIRYHIFCNEKGFLLTPECILVLLLEEQELSARKTIEIKLSTAANSNDLYYQFAFQRKILPSIDEVMKAQSLIREVYKELIPHLLDGDTDESV